MTFEDFLLALPGIYCYWTGMLLMWSTVTVIGLFQIILTIKNKGLAVRKSDITALITVTCGGLLLAFGMFIFSDMTSNLIDIMVLIDLWYTVFIAYVSGSSLSGWPVVHFSSDPRPNQPHRTTED